MDTSDTRHPHSGDQSADMFRATPRGRQMLVCALAGSVLLGIAFLAFFLFFLLPLITERINGSPLRDAMFILKVTFVSLIAIAVLAALFMVWYGRRIWRLQQFPLPGAWVWRDTPIKRGEKAIRIAWLHMISGIFISLLLVAVMLYLWRGIDHIKPRLKLPPGVTILR